MNLLSTMVCRLVSLEHMLLTTSALFSTVCVALIPNRIYQSSWASQLIHLTFYESAPLLSVVVMCSQSDILCHIGIDEARVLLLRWMKVRSAICSLKLHPHLQRVDMACQNSWGKETALCAAATQCYGKNSSTSSKSVQAEWTYPMTSFQIRVGKCNLLATSNTLPFLMILEAPGTITFRS